MTVLFVLNTLLFYKSMCCPRNCSCETNTSFAVNCEERNLSEIPEEHTIPVGVKKVILQRNRIETIPQMKSKERFKKVKLFNVRRNKIRFIASKIWNSFVDLEILHLDHNLISRIGEDAFETLTKLKTLSLSNNRLTAFEESWFASLKSLTDADFSYNRISNINSDNFALPMSLEMLNLGHNRIHLMPPFAKKTLQNSNKLKIELCKNPIFLGCKRKIHKYSFFKMIISLKCQDKDMEKEDRNSSEIKFEEQNYLRLKTCELPRAKLRIGKSKPKITCLASGFPMAKASMYLEYTPGTVILENASEVRICMNDLHVKCSATSEIGKDEVKLSVEQLSACSLKKLNNRVYYSSEIWLMAVSAFFTMVTVVALSTVCLGSVVIPLYEGAKCKKYF